MNKKVTGFIDFSVGVKCPECGEKFTLNEYPYAEGIYGEPCNKLGRVLFGGKNEPAQWEGLDIEIKCCGCFQTFNIERIEY